MNRFDPPPLPLRMGVDYPQKVHVTNPRTQGSDFFKTVRSQYDLLRQQAQEGQVAVMRYHSPAGELIRVTQVTLYRGSDTLIFYGDDGKNPCAVLAQAHSAQLTMKILPEVEAPESERRKPIGFTVKDTEQ